METQNFISSPEFRRGATITVCVIGGWILGQHLYKEPIGGVAIGIATAALANSFWDYQNSQTGQGA